MIRGTTPVISFTLPFDVSTLDDAYISFAQHGKVVIEKRLEDCKVDGNRMTVRLTQEDTLRLAARTQVEMQIRARTGAGEVIASNIVTTYADRILKDGVI